MDEDKLVDVYTIGDTEFPNRLAEDLHVNHTALSEVMGEHAEKFAWYSTAYELAQDHEARLKEELAKTYARLDHKIRMEAKGASVRMTEKMVENSVITHAMYTELQDKYLDAKRATGLLKAARDAMIHRRDMLIQMGANYRAEGAADVSLRAQQYLTNQNK